MPFKLKVIKKLQRGVAEFNEGEEKEGNQSGMTPSEFVERQLKKFSRDVNNFYQNLMLKTPIRDRHVINFFNAHCDQLRCHSIQRLPGNLFQDHLLHQKHQKSRLQATFHCPLPRQLECPLPTSVFLVRQREYTIDRFKSFGDEKFYRLALLLENAGEKLRELESYGGKGERERGNDKTEEYIESLNDRMFYCKGDNRLYISNSLLQLLEYDPENFALEMVKYRSSFYEAFSAENYFEVMSKVFENLTNLVDLVLGRISLEVFLNSSLMRYKDYLFTRSNKKIHAKVKTGMPTPLVTVCQLEEVITTVEDGLSSPYFGCLHKNEFTTVREERRAAERECLENLLGCVKEKKEKRSGYIELGNGADCDELKYQF